MLMGIWKVTGRNRCGDRIQNLAVRSIIVFNSTASDNKLAGILNQMGMNFVSKLNGTLMIQSQLLKVFEGVLSITSPTNAQEIYMKSHSFCTDKVAGCQNHIISSMKTERHNVAGRMVIKALSKGPWGAGLVDMDIGSGDRLA
eukprot:1142809-Pelagomonas_calceolata.AAC.1